MAFHNVPPNGFPDIPDIEDLEAVQGDIATLKTRTNEQGTAITGLTTNKAPKTDIAAAFSAESNYAVGDLVYYDGALYECTTAHEAAAWNAEDFTAASVASALNEVSSNLIGLDVALSVPENTGKNLITMTLSEIKSSNTNGTWADNVYTLDGLVFTVLTDSVGNVIGVKANGTAPANDIYFTLGHISFVKDTSYRMTSGTTGSTAETYRIWAYSSTAFPVGHRLSTDSNCGENVARDARANEICPIAFMIMSGYAPNNVIVYPMVRYATITDSTFAPYIPSVETRLDSIEALILHKNFSYADLEGVITSLLMYVRDNLSGVGGKTYIFDGTMTITGTSSTLDYNAVITKKSTHIYGMASIGNNIYNMNYYVGVSKAIYEFTGSNIVQ